MELVSANLNVAHIILPTLRSTMDVHRQTVKEFVNFVLSVCGE